MKHLDKFLIFSIFAVPITGAIPLRGVDVWFIQWLGITVFFCLMSSWFLWKFFNKSISFFGITCLFSAIYTAQYFPKALFCLYTVYLFLFSSWMVSKLNARQRANVLLGIMWFVIFQGVWLILQKFNLDPIFQNINNPGHSDTVGWSGSHNQISLFFAMTGPLILAMNPVLIILNILGLFFGSTSAAVAGFVISCVVMVWNYLEDWRGKAVIVFGLGLVVLIFFWKFERIAYDGLYERFLLWNKTIEATVTGKLITTQNKNGVEQKVMIVTNPIVGYGIGNFMRFSPKSQQEYLVPYWMATYKTLKQHVFEHAHNDYIEVFFEMGVIGILSLMWVILDFFIRFWKAKKTKTLLICGCGIISMMVSACGIYTTQTAVSGMMLMLFYGMFIGEVRDGVNAKMV